LCFSLVAIGPFEVVLLEVLGVVRNGSIFEKKSVIRVIINNTGDGVEYFVGVGFRNLAGSILSNILIIRDKLFELFIIDVKDSHGFLLETRGLFIENVLKVLVVHFEFIFDFFFLLIELFLSHFIEIFLCQKFPR